MTFSNLTHPNLNSWPFLQHLLYPSFSPVSLMATESCWLLRPQTGAAGSSFCHLSIAYLSGNPVGSTFRTWTEASNHSASWLLSCLSHCGLLPASLRRLPASVLSLPSRLRAESGQLFWKHSPAAKPPVAPHKRNVAKHKRRCSKISFSQPNSRKNNHCHLLR